MNNPVQTNKYLSVFIIASCLFYYIPKTIIIFDWLNSGVISSYFYLIAPINILVIAFGLLSVFSFRKQNTEKQNKILVVVNIIGTLVLIIWFPFVFGT